MLTKWEYLTLRVEYDKKQKDWAIHMTGKPPWVGLQAILNGYGSEGWELVSLQAEYVETYASFAKWCSEPEAYRATFKRAISG
jgi:hypothetical protein